MLLHLAAQAVVAFSRLALTVAAVVAEAVATQRLAVLALLRKETTVEVA